MCLAPMCQQRLAQGHRLCIACACTCNMSSRGNVSAMEMSQPWKAQNRKDFGADITAASVGVGADWRARNCIPCISARARVHTHTHTHTHTHEQAGERAKAKSIYAKLRFNGDSNIAQTSKQLMFGFEAMEFMKVDTYMHTCMQTNINSIHARVRAWLSWIKRRTS